MMLPLPEKHLITVKSKYKTEMQKLHLLFICLFVAFGSFAHEDENDPVVLTIDGEGIHESEFLYIYTKNNPNPSFKKKDLDAYMELFINYKLKVKEAERLGYDTIPKLQNELAQYRKQLALPYMIDKEKNEKLIEEAYYRTENELRASHILIRVQPNSKPEDTLKAYNRIMALRDRIIAGEDFSKVAGSKGGSEDPSVKMNKGDLGYFSALQMVYPFEETAFSTKVGEISMPVRTKFGYHIINPVDFRKAKGKMKAAHIMVLCPHDASKSDVTAAEEKINEIHAKLVEGADFTEMAKKFSDDQSSKAKGGALPEFGAGAKQRMVPEFEIAAFGLDKDGDFSKPFRTGYGFHIVMRKSLTPVPSYEDMYRELKLKVEKDQRAQKTKNSFVNKLRADYGFNDAEAQKLLPMFYADMTPEIFRGPWKGLKSDAHDGDILFSFKDQFYTVKDFETYLMNLQNKGKARAINEFVDEQFDIWSQQKLLEYEDSKLEEKYADFRALIQEYRDGILVFEIMQNEIWNKASSDTLGIKKYYEAHKGDFTYPVRYQGELYKCIDKATANQVTELAKSDTLSFGQIQDIVNENSQLNLIVKKHVFNSETTEAFKKGKKGKKVRKFKTGINKAFAKDGSYYVFKVTEIMQPRNREFKEAKGLVTAAFQNQMEKDWLEGLRKSHTIEIHHDALYAVGD